MLLSVIYLIGFYANDEIAKRYHVASPEGHTYAHHLLMEQSLKYLKKNGIAIFLASTDNTFDEPTKPSFKGVAQALCGYHCCVDLA